MSSNYDKHPVISITSDTVDCDLGWPSVIGKIHQVYEGGKRIICIECYPGVYENEIRNALSRVFSATEIFSASDALKPAADIDRMLSTDLSDDPVFGHLSRLELIEFFDRRALMQLAEAVRAKGSGVIVGTGASFVIESPDLLIYTDLARWEIQQRQRSGKIGNFGSANLTDTAATKYKRAFFVDWRVADRLKKELLNKADFLLDTNRPEEPRMISGGLFRKALADVTKRPFRVQPFFDPGPWGGQWMRKVCDLPDGPPNYAWCFDCVPEENSLLLGFGNRVLEIPAIDLVFQHPRELLGEAVYARFGAEFPIRFDFLDTMEGGNLSLQVHPLTEYIRQHFGMQYTQDESYYLLDTGDHACVYLGLKEKTDREAMKHDLRVAQDGGPPFPADQYVSRWAARKHDHFLIPAGTIHCSGRNSMVLEISATPYIFTFKLWDWGRLGLDGRPRPIHLDHGIRNIQWDRTTNWVRSELINPISEISRGEGWREERTGLHSLEFIETRRHWLTGAVSHDTLGGVNVLNLVEGSEVIVESPAHSFEPFTVHYAETFIVPAAVRKYTVRSAIPGKESATVKAFVRAGTRREPI